MDPDALYWAPFAHHGSVKDRVSMVSTEKEDTS